MRNRLALCLIVIIFCLTIPSELFAQGVPSVMTYQGRLTDSSGNLLGSTSGTTYYFKFSIWNVSTGGTAGTNRLWPSSSPTSVSATVKSGVFTVDIGDTDNGYPDTLNFDFNTNKNIYLQVEVSSDNNTFQTLSPRQKINSAPFAQVSGSVSGTGPSAFGTTTPFGTSVVSILATSTQSTALTLKGVLNQLVNYFQIQDSTGANIFRINSLGDILASSSMIIGNVSSPFIVNNSGNVGIGTSTPSRKLNVLEANSTPQIRVSQTSTEYGEVYVDATGDIQFSSTGGNIRHNDENLWICSGGSCAVDTPAGKGNVIIENSIIFNNKFKMKQTDASTTIMYDTTNTAIMEFDEGE